MTDFPVQNNNYHAMPIFAALRMAGIDATATGIAIQPRIPRQRYSLESQLVKLERDGNVVRGSYRPTGNAPRTLSFHAPTGAKLTSVRRNGKSVEIGSESSIELEFEPGDPALVFEIELGT
jgi:hypothetical protein